MTIKVLIFSGSHPRHLYVNKAVVDCGAEIAAVIMQRENLNPVVPVNIPLQDRRNFERHFRDRFLIEEAAFQSLDPHEVFSGIPTRYCSPGELNSKATTEFILKFKPDLVFIFGVDLIKAPVLNHLPKDRVNLHLGLSPWYRGSATLFWPFYFLEPQFAGATFHQIVPEADAGEVLHQCIPELMSGDGVHDVGMRTVIQARQDLQALMAEYLKAGEWVYSPQKTTGRLFLTREFKPAHLRVIYNTFNNDIVDEYLRGDLGGRKPTLIRHAVFNTL